MAMIRFKNDEVAKLHQDLGITLADLEDCCRGSSQAELDQKLTILKTRARKSFKKLALECHEDRTEDKDKRAYFSRLSSVYAGLKKLRVKYSPPAPVRQFRVFVTTGFTTSTSTSTNASTGWAGTGWRPF